LTANKTKTKTPKNRVDQTLTIRTSPWPQALAHPLHPRAKMSASKESSAETKQPRGLEDLMLIPPGSDCNFATGFAVAGAMGSSEAHINGIFARSTESKNGRPIYFKVRFGTHVEMPIVIRVGEFATLHFGCADVWRGVDCRGWVAK
jgi:hypothetical protein